MGKVIKIIELTNERFREKLRKAWRIGRKKLGHQ